MPRTARQAEADKEWRTVRLPLYILEELDEPAKLLGIHRNEFVRRIVEDAVDRRVPLDRYRNHA